MTRVFLLAALFACGNNQTFPDRGRFMPGDAGALDCIPDLNGSIESDELLPAIGVPVSLLVSPVGIEREVNIAGSIVDEQRVWSLDLDFADDQLAQIQASDLAGQWFADSFPEGEFVAPLDPASQTLGIFRHTETALLLYGLASAEENPSAGQTLYAYASPVEVNRFPITAGDEFVSVGEVSGGTLLGLPYAGRDIYEVRVVSTGRLQLIDFEFEQAHRVDTRVTVEPAVGVATSRRQVSWFFECFGEVARATSRPDETEVDFTTAAELRRLSLER
ncbi:MAG: hypothetical protein AAGE52_02510 [Myxococcota bacterium]